MGNLVRPYLERAAVISVCGTYRYRLWRRWASKGKPIMWLMLNPSTADETFDDPTIVRCKGFSERWGYSAMWIGNLYAYRTKSPHELMRQLREEPLEKVRGPENSRHLAEMALECERIVVAWGTFGPAASPEKLRALAPNGVWCLGLNAHGSPRHPLYLAGDTELRLLAA